MPFSPVICFTSNFTQIKSMRQDSSGSSVNQDGLVYSGLDFTHLIFPRCHAPPAPLTTEYATIDFQRGTSYDPDSELDAGLEPEYDPESGLAI